MNNWLHRFTRLNELFEKIELERIKLQTLDNVIAGYDAYSQELSSWSKSVDYFVAAPPPGVPAPIPNRLLKKCEERIEKARSQIETTLKDIPPVEKKIVLLIINRDFDCHLITMEQLEAKLQKPDLEVVCQFGDCY